MKKLPADKPPGTSRTAKFVVGLSCLNLLVLSIVNYLIYIVSETWWAGTVVTYAPRTPYVIPAIILLFASLIWHRPSIGMNLVSVGIALVPVMGLSIPFGLWMNGSPKIEGATSLTIVSCNVQSFQPDFSKVLDEIVAIKPDVIALQEAFGEDDRLNSFCKDAHWYTLRYGQYWIGSRSRMTLISGFDVTPFGGRSAGMLVQIEVPNGPIVLGNIHQMTARFGLKELNYETVINGKGTKELSEYQAKRERDSTEIRAAVNSAYENEALIVCGDFNTPTSSSLFRKHWGDLQSCYDNAGFGYGYTSSCKGRRLWPANFPWARIDHILCSGEWAIQDCQIGKTDGSDHRLIAATITLNVPK